MESKQIPQNKSAAIIPALSTCQKQYMNVGPTQVYIMFILANKDDIYWIICPLFSQFDL